MKRIKKFHTCTEGTYKISKSYRKIHKKVYKKMKYFITWYLKPKIEWKIPYKSSRNIIQFYEKHNHIPKNNCASYKNQT